MRGGCELWLGCTGPQTWDFVSVGYRFSFLDISRPELLPGLRLLADRKATLDIFTGVLLNDGTWSTSIEKIQQVDIVATAVPNLVMVVDHLGFAGVPGAIAPDFEIWSAGMALLAAHPNIYVKVSGGALGIDVMRPYFQFVIEKFGYSRCMWSSNWYNINVQEGFYSYKSWAATIAQYIIESDATDDDARNILYSTAARAYPHQRMLEESML